MREIKFRAWDSWNKKWLDSHLFNVRFDDGTIQRNNDVGMITNCIFMQYTGLKDKNGLTDIYECDIIGLDGLKKGNQYENTDLLKDQSNLLIQGFGTASWEATHKKAMERGCKYAE